MAQVLPWLVEPEPNRQRLAGNFVARNLRAMLEFVTNWVGLEWIGESTQGSQVEDPSLPQ